VLAQHLDTAILKNVKRLRLIAPAKEIIALRSGNCLAAVQQECQRLGACCAENGHVLQQFNSALAHWHVLCGFCVIGDNKRAVSLMRLPSLFKRRITIESSPLTGQ
jgi:hypothetical protein